MKKTTAILFVALILGLGWAIRGHFGHEWGASWAGAMAGLAVLVAAGRIDWLKRLPTITAMTAIGWGVGGMMSYGLIVGMGRAPDFGNVLYGLSMLAVIGGLYGFIGGGFLGLTLESTEEYKPDWPKLLTEMIAGGVLAWGILIYQFEWKMTPPRSELWAACVGAAAALAWFLKRNGYTRSLATAGYSALGAGFGFGFGNFLQTLGYTGGSLINWWNVMEFSVGFFGGIGLAYGVFSREWPESRQPSPQANKFALVFIFLVIPIVNILHAFHYKEFLQMAQKAGLDEPQIYADFITAVSWMLVILITMIVLIIWTKSNFKIENTKNSIAVFMLSACTFTYLMFGHIKKGFFLPSQRIQIEHYFYWFVVFISFLLYFFSRQKKSGPFFIGHPDNWKKWSILLIIFIIILGIASFISILIHDGGTGFQTRF